MESTESFWKQLWLDLQNTDGTPPVIRSQAASTLQDTDCSLFCLVYAAHIFICQPEIVQWMNASDSDLFQKYLACLLVMDVACDSSTGCLPIEPSLSFSKSQSPFFPLLVQSSLELLQRTVQQNSDDQSVILDFVERNVLPHMLGEQDYQKLQSSLEEGGISDELSKLVKDSVKHWTSKYSGPTSYISPILLFSSVFDDSTQAEDAQKLLAKNTDVPVVAPKDLLNLSIQGVKAPFARPLPTPAFPMSDYEDEDDEAMDDVYLDHLNAELIWCIPSCSRLMLLPDDDEDDDAEAELFNETLELLKAHAFVKPLAPNERRQVMEILSGDNTGMAGQLIKDSGLTPQNLPRLVEHNPLVAHECLLRILRTSPEDERNEYLSSLVGMDVSLNSMEVVNRLATHNVVGVDGSKDESSTPILHPEYILLFISSCIESCSNIPDRHTQNRLVRLVCVFIQALMRNRILDVDDILPEILSFCVEFSRIREASALFKSLKQQQQGG